MLFKQPHANMNQLLFVILLSLFGMGCENKAPQKDLSQQRVQILQKMLTAADDDYVRGKTVIEVVNLNPAKTIEEKAKERDGLIQAKHYLDRAKSVYNYVFRQEDLEKAFNKGDLPRRTLEARLAQIENLLTAIQKKIVE